MTVEDMGFPKLEGAPEDHLQKFIEALNARSAKMSDILGRLEATDPKPDSIRTHLA